MLSQKESEIIAKGIIQNFPGLSYDTIAELLPHFTIQHVLKHQQVIKYGQYYTNIVYVVSGLFRAFYHYKEVENTFWFRGQDSIFASPPCIFRQEPSTITYEALENSIIAVIDYNKLKEMAVENRQISGAIILVLETLMIHFINRIEEFSTLNTEERYISFLEKHSDITDRISQVQIASYLGITPESLSRLKNRIKVK